MFCRLSPMLHNNETKMQTQQHYNTTLPPELSALEASLATLEPVSGRREAVKSDVLMRLFEIGPPLSGAKLIETIVRTGDQEITLSLREYVKSARLVAGLYGAAIGAFVGLLLGIGIMLLVVNQLTVHHPQPVREVFVPYFVENVMGER